MADGSSNNNWVKGCLIAAGVLLVLGCCGFGISTVACGSLFGAGEDAQLQIISTTLRSATNGHPRAAEYQAELDRFDTVRSHVAFLTFGILNNRFTDAEADGSISPADLDHIMELIVDIDQHDGTVDMNAYPSGR